MKSKLALPFALTAILAVAQPGWAEEGTYKITKLVSDIPSFANTTDPNAINTWGIAFGTGPVWVTNNGTATSTLYDGTGKVIPLVVHTQADPTGIVWYDGSSDFKLDGTHSAAFLFATENGAISGWSGSLANPLVDELEVTTPGAVYKGLAIGGNGTFNVLYASNFSQAKVDTFGPTFAPVQLACNFTDPDLPAGYAPFGIQNILGDIYVTYAAQDAVRHDNLIGPGLGRVDVFTADGCLVRRLHSEHFNAPWGVALAPGSFGRFGGRVLIGNFGDGRINAFNVRTGEFEGTLDSAEETPIVIPGLWAISFGNGARNQPTNVLFFAAGPNHEQDGLYGRIDPVVPTSN